MSDKMTETTTADVLVPVQFVDDDDIDAFNSMQHFQTGGEQLGSEDEMNSGDTSSVASGSVTSFNNDVSNHTNSHSLWMADETPQTVDVNIKNMIEKTDSKKHKMSIKNPLKLIKQLSLRADIAAPLAVPEVNLDKVTVDSLPQQFVTKYLGKKRCAGLQGVENIKKPIDRMVNHVTKNPGGQDLPLVQLTVWPKGLQATIHPKSKSKDFEPFYLPVQFISFCSEHGSYQKIVGIISVVNMGPKSTRTECHAYICHSPLEARKLTVSMATAFRLYTESHHDNPLSFKVKLKDEYKGKNDKTPKDIDA